VTAIDIPEVALTGVSFRTLGISDRELLAQDTATPGRIARSLVDGGIAKEAAVLSTCNRFEIVTVGVTAEESLRDFFREILGVRYDRTALYELSARLSSRLQP
jgi:glutamyl-tRNA reductase